MIRLFTSLPIHLKEHMSFLSQYTKRKIQHFCDEGCEKAIVLSVYQVINVRNFTHRNIFLIDKQSLHFEILTSMLCIAFITLYYSYLKMLKI